MEDQDNMTKCTCIPVTIKFRLVVCETDVYNIGRLTCSGMSLQSRSLHAFDEKCSFN